MFGIAVLTQVDTQVDTVKLCKKQTSDRACERQCCSRGTLFSLQLEYDVAIRLQTGASCVDAARAGGFGQPGAEDGANA